MTELEIDAGAGPRRIELSTYLDAAADERAHEHAYEWIKALRHLRVDGQPFRRRWTFRGDSLWWFAELYLHKTQSVLHLHRTILAFQAMLDRERPLTVRCRDRKWGWLVRRLADLRGVRYDGPSREAAPSTETMKLAARARALHVAARASRLRTGRPTPSHRRVAAFVHKAFWRAEAPDAAAESYIGPVLVALERQVSGAEMTYVAIGPRTNFRARRWWSPLRPAPDGAAIPIERFVPLPGLAPSLAIWRARHSIRRALWESPEIRSHARILGCDCWPVIRRELSGIALLQFPWSTRVMDEAAAALDALRPRVAVTYAEAGGWGRALALECRRRGIPLVGLQHGFIYRHWLNYRHEPDEMSPDPGNPSDAGFPRPALTLLYDAFAAQHLASAGHFPDSSLKVTGSPRLDALVEGVRAIDSKTRTTIRQAGGASAGDRLVLVATKEREAAGVLPAFVEAVRGLPHVRVMIKPHPAETPGVYGRAIAGADSVHVLAPDADLASLLAAVDAVVTVNSTVAIDALAVGVPSLVLGLAGNLTPFVEAGVMANGGATTAEMRAALSRLLYDEEFRRRLLSTAARGAAPAPSAGGAAERSAAAILALAEESTH